MGWEVGSIPTGIVAVVLGSVTLQMTGEALASNSKEATMTKTNNFKTMIRKATSAVLLLGAGVGGNLIAGWLPASA